MSIDKYLARLGIKERPRPDLEGLTRLHRAHLFSIPYENIDVQLGRPVSMERKALLEKVVGRGRGGWCYEMNGTLGWALEELGFDVIRATGAVMRVATGQQAEANHLVLKVRLPEGDYLADVGFGDGPLSPFLIRAGEHHANGFTYVIEQVDAGWWRLNNHRNSNAQSFDFHLARGDEEKFAERCTWLQTAPEATFVQNLICFRHREGAIDALLGRTLRTMTTETVLSRTLDSADELVEVLGDVFGLNVPEAATLWPKVCARHEEILAQAK